MMGDAADWARNQEDFYFSALECHNNGMCHILLSGCEYCEQEKQEDRIKTDWNGYSFRNI